MFISFVCIIKSQLSTRFPVDYFPRFTRHFLYSLCYNATLTILVTLYSFDLYNLYRKSTSFCLSWRLSNLSLMLDIVQPQTNFLSPSSAFLSATLTISYYFYMLKLSLGIYHANSSPASQIILHRFFWFLSPFGVLVSLCLTLTLETFNNLFSLLST